MINIDAKLSNADWTKRTPDKFADLEESVQKYDPDQPRDHGRFAPKGISIEVGGRSIEVVKPKRARTDVLLPVDVAAFDADFSKSKGFYLSEGGGSNAKPGSYARFEEFILANDSIESPEVSVNAEGHVDFTNGRHRYAWLRDHGVKMIPMAISQDSVKYAKKFGYIATTEKWDESQRRDEQGRWTKEGAYTPDHDAPEKGEWDRSGVDPNAMVGPGPVWRQQHRQLVADALQSWVGDPSAMSIHMKDAIEGAPIPGSGSGKQMRAQAEALLWELDHNAIHTTVPVYRGSGQRGDRTGRIYSWSEKPEIAKIFAERYGGGITMLQEGARGLRLRDYTRDSLGEKQWLIRAGNDPSTKKFDEHQHPRDDEGKFVTFYHGTVQEQLDSIKAEGLKLTHAGGVWSISHKDTIYLGRTQEAAMMWAESTAVRLEWRFNNPTAVVLEIRVPKEIAENEKLSHHTAMPEGNLRVFQDIPPEWIVGVTKGRSSHDIQRQKSEEGETFFIGMVVGESKVQKREYARLPAGAPGSHGGEFSSTRGGMAVLHGPQDALDSLLNGERVNIDRDDVRAFLEKAAAQPEDPDLTDVHVEGMLIFGGNGLGIKRDDMPQIPREHRERFLKELRDAGIEITEEWVSPHDIYPTQREISARRVGEKLQKYEDKPEKQFPPLLVSRDGHVLDGHHHWGMMAALAIDFPEIQVPVYRLRVTTKRALELMHDYDRRHGIKRVSLTGEVEKWDKDQPRDADGKWVTLHRGEHSGNRGGGYYSPDFEFARQFTQSGLESEVKTVRIPKSQIYVPKEPVYASGEDTDAWDQAIAEARAQGFKAVEIDEGQGQPKSVYIFNKTVLHARKADVSGRFVTPFVDFSHQGDAQLQLIASLNSSRLATWGFTAEAEARGMTRYKLSAKLDAGTSDFCRMIDGRVFDVPDARKKVLEALRVQDPQDLKVVQPWPKQTKAAIAAFKQMSSSELTEAGFHIPPFHPRCRTMCTVFGPKDKEPILKPRAQVQDQTITQDTMKELGLTVTQEQIDHWNRHMGTSPVQVLEMLTGKQPPEILSKVFGTRAITFPEDGTIDLTLHSVFQDVKYATNLILDPFSGTLYLSKADLIAGTPNQAAIFMKRLIGGMVETAESIDASSIVILAGEEAAVFATMGFTPSQEVWDQMRKKTLAQITAGHESFNTLTSYEQSLITHLLESDDPTSLSALSQLSLKINGRPLVEWIVEGVEGGEYTLDMLNPLALDQARAYVGQRGTV